GIDECLQQRRANATPLRGGGDVDRVLHHPVVGGTGTEAAGVGIADDFAIQFGGQVRVAARAYIVHAPRHLGPVRYLVFVGVDEVGDLHRVDRGDGGNVGRGGVADYGSHFLLLSL